MKVLVFVVLGALIMGFAGCSSDDDAYVLTDRFFISQFQNISLNPNDFIGRTIRYDGIFMPVQWQDDAIYFVARFSDDDCCGGVGGIIGFEVYLNDIEPVGRDTWVEITGILEEAYDSDFGSFMRLNAVSMVELDEPGQEFVTK